MNNSEKSFKNKNKSILKITEDDKKVLNENDLKTLENAIRIYNDDISWSDWLPVISKDRT